MKVSTYFGNRLTYERSVRTYALKGLRKGLDDDVQHAHDQSNCILDSDNGENTNQVRVLQFWWGTGMGFVDKMISYRD